ncbi:TPA: GNAT family N-acetyltransferase [Providencia alcalifaciens]|nr:GNAT family N-acetyltransferase [Providencia alcalifaciens]
MTNNIRLRSLTPLDKNFFFDLYTRPNILRYISSQETEQEVQKRFDIFLTAWTFESTHRLCLVIEDSVSQKPLGLTGFTLKTKDNGQRFAEMSSLIDPNYAGKGIATAAVGLMLSKEEYKVIRQFRAVVTRGNHVSERVLRKNGFKLKETLKDNCEIDGVLYDEHFYELNR